MRIYTPISREFRRSCEIMGVCLIVIAGCITTTISTNEIFSGMTSHLLHIGVIVAHVLVPEAYKKE